MKGYKCDTSIIEKEIEMIDKVLDKHALKVTDHKECYQLNKYYVKMNYDTDIKELFSSKPNFAIALDDESIRLYRDGSNFIIEKKRDNARLLASVFERDSKWKNIQGTKILLGVDEDGNSVITDLAKAPHILVAGKAGSGKTMFLMNVINSIFFKSKTFPIVLDSSSQRLQKIYGRANHNYIYGSESNFRKLIDLNELLKQRLENMDKLGFANISGTEYLSAYIIVNGVEELISQRPDAEILLTNIAEFGAKAGFHLVLCIENMESGAYTKRLRDLIPVKVCFKTKNPSQSAMIIGYEGAETLFGNGDMFFLGKDMSKPIRIQAPFLSESDIESIAEMLGKVKVERA